MRKLHEKVKAQIEKSNEGYTRRANHGRQRVEFSEGDWVWLHLRKERFPQQRKSKLAPRGDGPFQVIKRIGENAYSLALPEDKYIVHGTFNVCDLSLFEGYPSADDEDPAADEQEDSRTNPSKEGEDDAHPSAHQFPPPTGPVTRSRAGPVPRELQGLGGPMTRQRYKKAQQCLLGLVQARVTQDCAEQDLQANHDQKSCWKSWEEKVPLTQYLCSWIMPRVPPVPPMPPDPQSPEPVPDAPPVYLRPLLAESAPHAEVHLPRAPIGLEPNPPSRPPSSPA